MKEEEIKGSYIISEFSPIENILFHFLKNYKEQLIKQGVFTMRIQKQRIIDIENLNKHSKLKRKLR